MHGSVNTCVGGGLYMVMGSVWRVLAGGEAERKPLGQAEQGPCLRRI